MSYSMYGDYYINQVCESESLFLPGLNSSVVRALGPWVRVPVEHVTQGLIVMQEQQLSVMTRLVSIYLQLSYRSYFIRHTRSVTPETDEHDV